MLTYSINLTLHFFLPETILTSLIGNHILELVNHSFFWLHIESGEIILIPLRLDFSFVEASLFHLHPHSQGVTLSTKLQLLLQGHGSFESQLKAQSACQGLSTLTGFELHCFSSTKQLPKAPLISLLSKIQFSVGFLGILPCTHRTQTKGYLYPDTLALSLSAAPSSLRFFNSYFQLLW